MSKTTTPTLSDRIEALLNDLNDEQLQAEIEQTEKRLALLRALYRGKSGNNGKHHKAKTNGQPDADKADASIELAHSLGIYLRDTGPTRIDKLGKAFNEFEKDVIHATLTNSTWFEREGSVWKLTSDGWTKFRKPDDE